MKKIIVIGMFMVAVTLGAVLILKNTELNSSANELTLTEKE